MECKVILTCLFGDYDTLQQAPNFNGWNSILFTDKKTIDPKGWDVRVVKNTLSPEKESRRYKFLSHIYLKEYDLVCYIDANMILTKEPPSVPFWNPHPNRKRVIDEARKINELGKADKSEVDRFIQSTQQAKFRDDKGLFQNGFFVRRHSMVMNALMDKTFDLVEIFTYRDQLALPFACHLLNIFPEGLQRFNRTAFYTRLLPHKKQLNKKIQVHHITPARSDKNFGLAVNQAIEGLPENDWICLRDIDTVPPFHEEFIKQVEEIANNSQGYSLIGCMTNRLGLPWQLVPNMFNEWDMKAHRYKAKELASFGGIKPLTGLQTVGGLFMLFSKATWRKAGKFPEGGIEIKGKFVDYHFSRAVAKFGKLGIAQNIYLFHLYRPDAKDTRTNKDHLK